MCIRDSAYTEEETEMFRDVLYTTLDVEVAGWVPVSYTHLDVYKRQELTWVVIIRVLSRMIETVIHRPDICKMRLTAV